MLLRVGKPKQRPGAGARLGGRGRLAAQGGSSLCPGTGGGGGGAGRESKQATRAARGTSRLWGKGEGGRERVCVCVCVWRQGRRAGWSPGSPRPSLLPLPLPRRRARGVGEAGRSGGLLLPPPPPPEPPGSARAAKSDDGQQLARHTLGAARPVPQLRPRVSSPAGLKCSGWRQHGQTDGRTEAGPLWPLLLLP